jgi:glycerol kinase
MNVLAIDQGTSATKALVVGEGGEILGEGVAPVDPAAAGDGAVEQDPGELLESVLAAGRAAWDAAGGEVDAIGLGNQGETVLRWDRSSGEPIGPAISWQDRRSRRITDRLRDREERLRAITGLPLDPYFAAPKMRWLSDESDRRPPSGDEVITTIDAWVTQRLTGAYVTDAATASRTMLLDLARGQWSEEACEIFDWSVDRLPRVVACDEVVGDCSAFGAAVPVSALIVDQQAALYAESCFGPGDAKCTYGTGAFLLANTGRKDVRSGAGLSASVAWRLGEDLTYCLDGQVYTAGAAITWLRQLGLIADAGELDGHCAKADRDSPGPVFVPALAGLAAPVWSPEARGVWSGLALATSASDLVSAVVWGIASEVTRLAASVEQDLGAPLSSLRVDGGLTRSQALMQAQADLLQIPVEVYPNADATALGTAALALRGAKGSAPAPSRPPDDWKPRAVFEPRISGEEAEARISRYEAAARLAAELA